MWERLRARQVGGWKFRRQHPIGPYFVDFYCPAAHLVVEITGPGDDCREQAERKTMLERLGYQVLSVSPNDAADDLDGVIREIYGELLDRGNPFPPARRVAGWRGPRPMR